MLPAIRKNKIKDMLLERKNVTVLELADDFSVTSETIRRDLKDLELEGIAERTHGGAILKEKVLCYSSKDLKNIFVESKKKIAKSTKPLIRNGACIFLDSSTTVQYLIDELRNLQLTIVTNSLDIATEISEIPNLHLIFLGGNLSTHRNCFVGSNTCSVLENYHFDIALFSCRALSMKEGIMESDDEEAQVKRIASTRANKLVLLADYSKFDKVAFTKTCDIKAIDYLVTDKALSPDWIQFLAEQKIEYVVDC